MSSEIPFTTANIETTKARLDCFSVNLDGHLFKRSRVNLSKQNSQDTVHLLPRHLCIGVKRR